MGNETSKTKEILTAYEKAILNGKGIDIGLLV